MCVKAAVCWLCAEQSSQSGRHTYSECLGQHTAVWFQMYYNFHWALLSTRVMGFLFPFSSFSLSSSSLRGSSRRAMLDRNICSSVASLLHLLFFLLSGCSLSLSLLFALCSACIISISYYKSFTAYHFVIQAITMSTRQLSDLRPIYASLLHLIRRERRTIEARVRVFCFMCEKLVYS